MTLLVKRRTSSIFRNSSGELLRPTGIPRVDYRGNFQKSIQASKVPVNELRNFSEGVLVQKAISRIANGVLAMPWQVLPPKEDMKKDSAHERADVLTKALLRPNREDHNTYSKFVRAIISEIMTLGFAAVERHPGSDDTQPFWMFLADGARIRVNTEWKANETGLQPRYYQVGASRKEEWVPFMAKEMFIMQMNANAYQLVPPSPVAIAYKLIRSWLGLGEYKDATVSRGVKSFMLTIEDEDVEEADLESFRTYWETEVEGKGKVPILAGKIKKTDLTGKTDEELYPKYTEYLLRLIALGFNLASRDFNLTEPDNRATAEVSADHTFAQAVLPMALCVGEHFGVEIIDFYEPGFRLEYADTEPRGQKEESEIAGNLFEKGVITRNEARGRVGEDAIPNGDRFNDGAGVDVDDNQPMPEEEPVGVVAPPAGQKNKPPQPAEVIELPKTAAKDVKQKPGRKQPVAIAAGATQLALDL